MSPSSSEPNRRQLQLWQKISSKQLADYRIFTIRADQMLSPRTGKPHEFFVLDCVDWVNVIATTPDNHLVMVEQYRHGTNTIELEIPGGMMDSSDASPVATAIRELQEETGFSGDSERAELIGKIFSNPAIISNTTHTVLIENCVEKHERIFDPGEDLVTRLVPIAEIPNLVREGKIRHSLVAVALFHFELWRKRG